MCFDLGCVCGENMCVLVFACAYVCMFIMFVCGKERHCERALTEREYGLDVMNRTVDDGSTTANLHG